MSKTAIASKDETPTAAPAPRAIAPANMTLDYGGQHSQHWHCVIPAGMNIEDALLADVWSAVRASRAHPIRVMDRIDLVTGDRKGFAEALVVEVPPSGLVLKISKVVELTQSAHQYLQAGGFEVKPEAGGFRVYRCKDGVPVTAVVANEIIANRELHQQFPRRA